MIEQTITRRFHKMNPELSLFLLQSGKITQEEHDDNVAAWEQQLARQAKIEAEEAESDRINRAYLSASISGKKRIAKEVSANLAWKSVHEEDSYESRRMDKKAFALKKMASRLGGSSVY